MSYHTTDLHGITEINPPETLMRDILASLETDDTGDHPEVWLTHLESGWCLTALPGGTLLLDNDTHDDTPRRLRGLSLRQTLDLWKLLAAGHIRELLRHPWQNPDDDNA